MAVHRELQLGIARCCTAYVIALEFAVPACSKCGLTPTFEHETQWFLTTEDLAS